MGSGERGDRVLRHLAVADHVGHRIARGAVGVVERAGSFPAAADHRHVPHQRAPRRQLPIGPCPGRNLGGLGAKREGLIRRPGTKPACPPAARAQCQGGPPSPSLAKSSADISDQGAFTRGWGCAAPAPNGAPRKRPLQTAGPFVSSATPVTPAALERGRSSGVEHNLAKVGVEGSNPFARSRFCKSFEALTKRPPPGAAARAGNSTEPSGRNLVRRTIPQCARRPASSS